MRFKKFIEGTITNLDDYRKKKDSEAFRTKLNGVVDSIPAAFATQAEVEKLVKQKLDEIDSHGACFNVKFKNPALMSPYQKGINPVTTIYWAHQDILHDEPLARKEVAQRLVKEYGQDIVTALQTDLKAIKALYEIAKKAPAKQYAERPLDYAVHEYTHMLDYFKKVVK